MIQAHGKDIEKETNMPSKNTKDIEMVEDIKPVTYGKVVGCYALNMRETPEIIDDNIITKILENTLVEILEEPINGFIKVRTNDVIGYCMEKFIEKE